MYLLTLVQGSEKMTGIDGDENLETLLERTVECAFEDSIEDSATIVLLITSHDGSIIVRGTYKDNGDLVLELNGERRVYTRPTFAI